MLTLTEINQLRKEYAYSYEMISEESGVPLSTVQKVLGGVTKNPRRETLEAISKIFECKNISRYSIYPDDGSIRQVLVMEDTAADYMTGYGGYRPSNRKGYSAAQLENISGNARWELIDGVLYYLAAPTVEHQLILNEISFSFNQFIRSKHKNCIPLSAPVDIYYSESSDDRVQPDFMVYCDPDKRKNIRDAKKRGVPDFVCEIISPSTSAKDYYLKRNIYKEHGVREYWMIDYAHNKITVEDFTSDAGQEVYHFSDKVPVNIYNGELVIDFAAIKALLEETEGDVE